MDIPKEMTLLDLFAAFALAGLIANTNYNDNQNDETAPGVDAKLAYRYAHIMLKEREQQTEQPST